MLHKQSRSEKGGGGVAEIFGEKGEKGGQS